MSNVLHEVINSGQPWAAERAQYALQIAEALQNGQVSQDEARALLADLINTEKYIRHPIHPSGQYPQQHHDAE